jgi:tRNA(His) 5'-end guanylyltransferase
MIDTLGDRIKSYENVSRSYLMRRNPVMLRCDGKSFHNFTKNFNRPFDQDIITAMVYSALCVAEEIQGFKIAYIQSDEASFVLTDYEEITTQGWFDYNVNKMVSISAALMSVAFNRKIKELKPNVTKDVVFDSRAFSVPKDEVANALLFRQKDWERNSLQMYCRSFFSHKELEGKKKEDMHEMLHKIGKNWTNNLPDQIKNGTFLVKTESGIVARYDILPKYDSISKIVNPLVGIFETTITFGVNNEDQ